MQLMHMDMLLAAGLIRALYDTSAHTPITQIRVASRTAVCRIAGANYASQPCPSAGSTCTGEVKARSKHQRLRTQQAAASLLL